jgi:hypothetical protein
MNNFLKALKIKSLLSVQAMMVLFASSMYRKVLFKFLLASIKTLTNSGYFTGSRIRISPLSSNSKGIVSLNSAFENGDSQSSNCFEK